MAGWLVKGVDIMDRRPAPPPVEDIFFFSFFLFFVFILFYFIHLSCWLGMCIGLAMDGWIAFEGWVGEFKKVEVDGVG